VTYSNLTYDQVCELLKRDNIVFQEKEYNLFDFLLHMGRKLAKKNKVGGEEIEGLEKLALLKLVQRIPSPSHILKFEFTDAGHNFYLKALLFSPKP